MSAWLRRVTLTRLDTGAWDLLRERDETGERFVVDDLHDAREVVLAAYRPDGSPRGLVQSEMTSTDRGK